MRKIFKTQIKINFGRHFSFFVNKKVGFLKSFLNQPLLETFIENTFKRKKLSGLSFQEFQNQIEYLLHQD